MPDIPIEFSTATLPVAVQIAIVMAIAITALALFAWLILGRARATLQTSAECRDVRWVRRFLLYLISFVLTVAVIVSLLFIFLGTWNGLNSLPDSAPEQWDGDSAGFNHFPSEKPEEANPNEAGDGEADGAD